MAKTIDRPAARPETADLTQMTALARRFERLRQRSRRQWRRYQSLDDGGEPKVAARAHAVWSAGIDETLGMVEAISRAPANDVGELALQFEAIVWWVMEDDSILDVAVRLWLMRFRKSLRRLARQS